LDGVSQTGKVSVEDSVGCLHNAIPPQRKKYQDECGLRLFQSPPTGKRPWWCGVSTVKRCLEIEDDLDPAALDCHPFVGMQLLVSRPAVTTQMSTLASWLPGL
jgi:hypothetical protein